MFKKLIFTLFFLLFFNILFAELEIFTTEEPPVNYSKKGEFFGTSIDIVREIQSLIGDDTPIKFYPWIRAYQVLITNDNVIAFTAAKTNKRVKDGVHFVGPLFFRSHTLYKKKGKKINIKSLEDILSYDLKLAGVRSEWRTDFFMDYGANVEENNTHHQNLQMLLLDRVDLWITSKIEAHTIAQELDVSMEEIEEAFIFKEAGSYILFSKNIPPEILKEWEDGLRTLEKTDFFDKLTKKWSELLGITMIYSSEKGVHAK